MKCNECRHKETRGANEYCTYHDAYIGWHGCEYGEPKQQTNADRIRQMSDEELCVFLAGIYTLDTDAYGDYDPCVVIDDHKFREPNGLMDWLKSPVEVDE